MSDVIKPPAGWKKTRDEEQMLRQFLQVDGPKGATQAFRDGWERIFGEKSEKTERACTNEDMCSECGHCLVCTDCQCNDFE